LSVRDTGNASERQKGKRMEKVKGSECPKLKVVHNHDDYILRWYVYPNHDAWRMKIGPLFSNFEGISFLV